MNELSTDGFEVEEDYMDSHYMRPHWARAATETPVLIGADQGYQGGSGSVD